MKTLALALLLAVAAAQADTLVLRDGTRVTGRWWSADATHIHFLVENQLQHYPRAEVSAVAFGSLEVAPLPQAPAVQPQASAPPARTGSAPARTADQPSEIGAVYFQNGSGDLVPLERNVAVEKRSGPLHYWEMRGARSRVRLKTAADVVFVVKLGNGIEPGAFGLYPLGVVGGNRRTSPDRGPGGPGMKLSFTVEKTGESTYSFTVKDLDTGEYAFSRDGSNDSYCFGVDAAGGR